MFDVAQVEALVAGEGQDASRRAHHHVGTLSLQNLLVLLDGQTPEEHGHLFAQEENIEFINIRQ